VLELDVFLSSMRLDWRIPHNHCRGIAAQVGFVIIMTGIVGSFAGGWLLDKTGRFCLATNLIYAASAVSWVLLALGISRWSFLSIYFMSGLVGFFMTGLLPVVRPMPKDMGAGKFIATVNTSAAATATAIANNIAIAIAIATAIATAVTNTIATAIVMPLPPPLPSHL